MLRPPTAWVCVCVEKSCIIRQPYTSRLYSSCMWGRLEPLKWFSWAWFHTVYVQPNSYKLAFWSLVPPNQTGLICREALHWHRPCASTVYMILYTEYVLFHFKTSQSACLLVGFWADKSGWCWFVVRGKHCWLADKPWLKPINEQAKYLTL